MKARTKLDREDQITLLQTNAVEFTHACITIALHQEHGLGEERLHRVNLRRDEVNGAVLELLTNPAGGTARQQVEAAGRWCCAQLPEGTETELHIPMLRGKPRKQKEWQNKMIVDGAATLEWRVYALACAQVLGYGAERLNRLHRETVENFRQLNAWVEEDGVDVAMERLCRCARDAYKKDVQVEDVPDAEYLRKQRQETNALLRDMEVRAVRTQVSRMRVPCVLPLSGKEMEARIRAVNTQTMPDSWSRRKEGAMC